MYNEKYLKPKVKSNEGKLNVNFNDNGMPKEGTHCFCLPAIWIDSVFKISKNYYLYLFLEDIKYVFKEKR